jgi:hypothetical protein
MDSFNDKLSKTLVYDIARKADKAVISMSLEEFMFYFNRELTLTEDYKVYNFTTTETKTKQPALTSLATVTNTQNIKPPLPCFYCKSTEHKPINCHKIPLHKDRYHHVVQKKHCTNCFGNHFHLKCLSNGKCFVCMKKHHTSIHELFAPRADTTRPQRNETKTTTTTPTTSQAANTTAMITGHTGKKN